MMTRPNSPSQMAGTGLHLTQRILRANSVLRPRRNSSEEDSPPPFAIISITLVLLTFRKTQWSEGVMVAASVREASQKILVGGDYHVGQTNGGAASTHHMTVVIGC
eukprot:scaffold3169_cov117-Skeletonema_dohrnii-CCMP3373.AAC.5